MDQRRDEYGNLRWMTPMALTILIAVITYLTTEIRALRVEVAESRKFSVEYTDKMIELVINMGKGKR